MQASARHLVCAGGRWRCLSYYVLRARLNLQLLDQLDLIGRTGELARTFGIDFFSGGGGVGQQAELGLHAGLFEIAANGRSRPLE